MIGAAAGGVLVIGIPPAFVQIGVGLFILWCVFGSMPSAVRDWPFAIGVASTFLTMFFGATGPFVATFSKSLGLRRHGHVATHAALMSVQHVVKTATFGLFGFAFADWAAFAVAMIAAGFAGTLTGGMVLNRMDDARFRRALDIVLLLVAARLVIGGVAMLSEDAG